MTDPMPNAEQTAYWNGEEAAHWVTHEDRYDAMLRPFVGPLLTAAGISESDRVLDVGCGCGATTRAAARVADHGAALGVDLSEPMLEYARSRAREEKIGNARFEQADAQVHPFEAASFEVAISRFGVMFFADAVAALANIARALRPGGRVAFVCWQDLLSNEWISVPGLAAAEHVPLPDLGAPGAPGPFSMADRARLDRLLLEASFADVHIEPVEEPLSVGREIEETVDFLRETGMGRALLAGADRAAASRALDAVREALVPYRTPDGVVLGSAAWLVTARR